AAATAAEATPTAVVGVRLADLQPEAWIARLEQPDRVILDRAAIHAQNARMRAEDRSILDVAALPDPLPRAWVRERIEALSAPPSRALYDVHGKPVPAKALAALQRALALDAIPATQPLRYGLVVRRADLRTFPTPLRVFASAGDTDIDRFQESALFPGDAVAVLHRSRDGRWLFVASERYTAWIEAAHVAVGPRETVLGYASRAPYVVVTGASVRTAYTPEEPRVSSLQLDMGLRLPLRADWPPMQAVNGQHPYASHVVDLPVRAADGTLELVPALVPRSADVSDDYLPLTPANLIRQAFKFLGERYGWGHAYGTRDCSGFVSEVYRSFGVLLPRNTRDQAVSPALDRVALGADDGRDRRLAAVRALQPGDLVYIPGHVMMAIGHRDGTAYVIHDTNGGSWRGADGGRVRAGLNGVSVTPLEPLLFNDTDTYVDRITSIQRIRARTAP
ncbi:MAG TPA: SH3 domain-containing protein, partial [Pseudoxanthomonas sp.]|nr:SH3 domain-containing protein [Pseudoxanthomonas sp.]